MIDLEVPRYEELSVDKIWGLVKNVPELMLYFPNYKVNQLPDRKHMFSILATYRYEQLNSMIEIARKNRSLERPVDDNQLVYITQSFYDEIKGVSSQKWM